MSLSHSVICSANTRWNCKGMVGWHTMEPIMNNKKIAFLERIIYLIVCSLSKHAFDSFIWILFPQRTREIKDRGHVPDIFTIVNHYELTEYIQNYRQVSNISRTLVGNNIVDHSDVERAPPVGAAPTTSSFPTYNTWLHWHGGPSEAGDCSHPPSKMATAENPTPGEAAFDHVAGHGSLRFLAYEQVSDRANFWYSNVRSPRVRMA